MTVNLNTRTTPQIAPILNVSEAAAETAVNYRAEHGDFRTLEDLNRVPGVAVAKIEDHEDRLSSGVLLTASDVEVL
jgi:competence protein ComEA